MKNKWLHFDIDKENIFGLMCGMAMLILSVAMMLLHNEISNIILRDICMILLLGFLMPLHYILIVKKKSLSVWGLHKNKLAAKDGNQCYCRRVLALHVHQQKRRTDTF